MTNQKRIEASNDGFFGVADVACVTGSKNKRKVFQTGAEHECWRAVRLLVLKSKRIYLFGKLDLARRANSQGICLEFGVAVTTEIEGVE